MSVHEGHRQRKKEQFREHGLDAFADHEALELLLYYAIPRQDTNPIAHRLLERFGSLEGVFSAPAYGRERRDAHPAAFPALPPCAHERRKA